MLVLLRHGESEWNSPNINRFCGWVDVHLSTRGIQQAKESGQKLKSLNIQFDVTFPNFKNSFLARGLNARQNKSTSRYL